MDRKGKSGEFLNMAAIDKIYGDMKQYDEFVYWCEINNPDILKYFYTREDSNSLNRPITNFPESVDKWLLDNCPIKFVTDRIKEQYGLHQDHRGNRRSSIRRPQGRF